MSTSVIGRPATSEYASYFGRYIDLVDETDVIAVLERQLKSTRILLGNIAEDKANHRYAPGKWSIKELVGHIVDSERVFAYRALRFARNDQTELPGFDQDAFAANANFGNLPLSDIVQEYEAVRTSTLLFLRHLPPEAWSRRGIANGNEMTVRALAFTIAGHEVHHVQILRDRYL
jgi:DinB superfamily